MGKEEEEVGSFYSPVGVRMKRWWKNLERYGFYVSVAEFGDQKVEKEFRHPDDEDEDDDDGDDQLYVGDPFCEVTEADIEVVSEGDANLTGACTVQLKSGFVLGGCWRKGRRKGPGIISGPALEAKGIKAIWGNYKSGVLNGKGGAELDDKEETILDGEFVDGRLEGKVRGFSNRVGLTFVSTYHRGRPVGPSWKALHGGSFLYSVGQARCDGKFTGDEVAYIYPDYETVLQGTFADDVMIEARESKVTGCFLENGVLRLEMSQPRGEVFKFWPSKWSEVICPPLQEDPFEKKVIRAETSSVPGAGDGLFARVDIPANTACAFYNGIRVKPGEPEPFPCEGYQIYVDWNKANKITSDYMDIPPDLVSLTRYRASLGHKVNHSFEPNCRWGTIDHPTFGHVPRIVTLTDIPARTELTTHYKLDMDEAASNGHSRWYAELWEKFSLKSSQFINSQNEQYDSQFNSKQNGQDNSELNLTETNEINSELNLEQKNDQLNSSSV